MMMLMIYDDFFFFILPTYNVIDNSIKKIINKVQDANILSNKRYKRYMVL